MPLIGAIETTLSYLLRGERKNRRITVLGGHIVHKKAPYRQPLLNGGFDYVELAENTQQEIEELIYSIKRNEISLMT